MHIFNGPMAHITNGKVKTNMFLIWAGPNGENKYENLQLSPSQQYNLDAVLKPSKDIVSQSVTFFSQVQIQSCKTT